MPEQSFSRIHSEKNSINNHTHQQNELNTQLHVQILRQHLPYL